MLFETVFAEPAATAANGAAATGGSLISAFALPVIMLVVLYFIMIRPQRKKGQAC
ncbi:MAG: preprotein translocase subunit YajC [Clostridiales bacterium]|nr:MAG: preprotein translocase subunit YajC [Clostridiales bacterium]